MFTYALDACVFIYQSAFDFEHTIKNFAPSSLKS